MADLPLPRSTAKMSAVLFEQLRALLAPLLRCNIKRRLLYQRA